MPPIEINGQTVSDVVVNGQSVDQVTANGQTVFAAIPDSVIDNFEDDPDGPYGDSNTVADFYSGDTDAFSRTTADVVEGQEALGTDTTGTQMMVSEPGEGLLDYPDEDDTISVLLRQPADIPQGAVIVRGSISSGNISGYAIRISDGAIVVRRIDDGSDTVILNATDATEIDDETWHWVEVSPPTDEDSVLKVDVFELDTTNILPASNTPIESESVSDSNYTVENGVGAARFSGSGTGTFLDFIGVNN